jgi:hypothetical protein
MDVKRIYFLVKYIGALHFTMPLARQSEANLRPLGQGAVKNPYPSESDLT